VPKVSETHREERRRQILDGARTAFAAHGYEGATVNRLEDAIGLSRGAIFSYFPTKWDLFFALASEDQERVALLWLDAGIEGVIRHVADESPEWVGVYLEVGRMLRTDPKLREAWNSRNPELVARVGEHVAERQREGTYRDDLPTEAVGQFMGVVLDGLALHIAAGYPVDAEGTLELVRSALRPK
jgi:TetR/AcrR family transcriptional regulator, transcriptional repressor of aconitase